MSEEHYPGEADEAATDEASCMEPMTPHALTREQCSLCTANRPRLCDQHYKQGADELLKHVTAAIQDQQTPGGVKATYEQLLELCNQQRQALAQQAQEIERLEGVCLDRLRSGQRLADENILLRQSLASMTAERDLLQHRFDDAIEAIDRMQRSYTPNGADYGR